MVDGFGQVHIAGDHAQGGGKPVRPGADHVPGAVETGVNAQRPGAVELALRPFRQLFFLLLLQHGCQHFVGDDLHQLLDHFWIGIQVS